MFDMPVIEHCEEQTLKGDGVAHEGFHASALGPARHSGRGRVDHGAARHRARRADRRRRPHRAHERAADARRGPLRQGARRARHLRGDAAPFHRSPTRCSAAPIAYDTNVKMNPPLREAADRDAMLAGIADGSVDVIATDHAPHHYDEKQVEFDRAPFGITGLETAVSLCFDRLVHAGRDLAAAAGRAAVGEPGADPARARRLARGGRAGRHHDPGAGPARSRSSAATMRSKSKNTPFDGWHAARRRRRDDRRRPDRSTSNDATDCRQLEASAERSRSDGQTRGASREGAEGPAAVRGADARRPLRLRQRLSRPRLPQPAPAVPPSVDDLALRAGPDRRAAGASSCSDRSRRRPGDRRRAARAHDCRAARQPPQPHASAVQLRAVQLRSGRRLRAAAVLPRASSRASACCWPTMCGTPARRSRAARRWCRRRAARSSRRSRSTIGCEAIVDLGVPNFALAEYKAPENYTAADCPLCAQQVPITRF